MIAADLRDVQVWIATTPVDMRKSFDSLSEVVRSFLGHDPLSGHLFVFRNKRSHLVKILWWDTDGLAIYYKKLEAEDTHILDFTEVRWVTHNRRVGPCEAGRMVRISWKPGSRRIVMQGQGSPIVPPRALRKSG